MAGIIKANGRRTSRAGVQSAAFNFADIGGRANDYLDRVRAEAERIIAEARAQADDVQRRAAESGRQAALEQLRAESSEHLEQQAASLVSALHEAIHSIRQSQDAWLKHWEDSATRLAVAIAQRVIKRQIDHTPQIALELLREALELAAGRGRIRVLLNPEDHAALGGQLAQLAEQIDQFADAVIVPDATVSPGGCMVKSEFGTIDQRLETRLARIEEELVIADL